MHSSVIKGNAKLEAAMAAINGQFGKASIISASSEEKQEIDYISTGHFKIDEICGGGLPRGRITEIYAGESAGKTTLVIQSLVQAQKQGLIAAFIDVEHAVSFDYLKQMGVDLDNLLFSQPSSAEEVLEIVQTLVKSEQVSFIAVDSVAAFISKREMEGAVNDEHVAEVARLMSKELKKLVPLVDKANCALVFINQLRDKPGVTFGKTTTTGGGRALKFYASLRLEITRIENFYRQVSGDKLVAGQINQIETVKNKVGPPKRKVKVVLRYPTQVSKTEFQSPGYDGITAMIEEASELGVLETAGAGNYTALDGTKLKGKESARNYYMQNVESAAQLMALVKLQ